MGQRETDGLFGTELVTEWDVGEVRIDLVDRRFAEAHPDLFRSVGRTRGPDILGAECDVELAQVSGYEIAGTPFREHTIAIVDLPRGPARSMR